MRSKSHRCVLFCFWIAVIVGAAGCGEHAPTVQFAKVQGTVRANGRAQPSIQVIFGPDKEKGNGLPAFAGGVSDDQGNYTLKYSYHNKTGEGAPVGWNRVTLADMKVGVAREGQPLKPSAIPRKYGNQDDSPLVVEVKQGIDNKIDLDVK